MRQSRWLRVIAAAVLVSSAWVSVGHSPVSALTAQDASSGMTPVATVRQIMTQLTSPASEVVFSAVLTVSSPAGVENIAPKDDEEWQKVVDNAAMLVESGNLLLMGDRVQDQGDWIKMTHALIEASIVSMKAAKAKDVDALYDSFDGLYLSCENCHLKYFP